MDSWLGTPCRIRSKKHTFSRKKKIKYTYPQYMHTVSVGSESWGSLQNPGLKIPILKCLQVWNEVPLPWCFFYLAIISLLCFALFLFDFFPFFPYLPPPPSYLLPLLVFLSQFSTPSLPWRSDKATITVPSPFPSLPSVSFLTSWFRRGIR